MHEERGGTLIIRELLGPLHLISNSVIIVIMFFQGTVRRRGDVCVHTQA
jgi:hypothetical protein